MVTPNFEELIRQFDDEDIVVSKEEDFSNLDLNLFCDAEILCGENTRDNFYFDNNHVPRLQQWVTPDIGDGNAVFGERPAYPPREECKSTHAQSVNAPLCLASLEDLKNSSENDDAKAPRNEEKSHTALNPIVPTSSNLQVKRKSRISVAKRALVRDEIFKRRMKVEKSKVFKNEKELVSFRGREYFETPTEEDKSKEIIDSKIHESKSEHFQTSLPLFDDNERTNTADESLTLPYTREEFETADEILKTKNRLAARRCRKNQRDRIERLQNTADAITEDNNRIEREIDALRQEVRDLTYVLNNHACVMRR